MKKQTTYGAMLMLCCVATTVEAVDMYRYEAGMWNNREGLFSQFWFVHTTPEWQMQLYAHHDTFFEDSFQQANATVGPVINLPSIQLAFPAGIRFRPEENGKLSHVVTKLNGIGRVGDFPFLFIHDLSWALDAREVGEHFFHYQIAWHPKKNSCGVGLDTQILVLGKKAESLNIGPVFQCHEHVSTQWLSDVEVTPFWDVEVKEPGVRINIMLFHF